MPRAVVSKGQLATQLRSRFRGPWVLPIVSPRHPRTPPRRPSTTTPCPYLPSPFRSVASRSRAGRMAISAISPRRPSSAASRRARGAPAYPPTGTASSAEPQPNDQAFLILVIRQIERKSCKKNKILRYCNAKFRFSETLRLFPLDVNIHVEVIMLRTAE